MNIKQKIKANVEFGLTAKVYGTRFLKMRVILAKILCNICYYLINCKIRIEIKKAEVINNNADL